MKNKRLSGFTLVECLMAMLILGIGSLTMAQVYAAVAKQTMENEFMNISLAEQMAYVEQRSGDTVASVAISSPVPLTQTLLAEEMADHELNDDSYHVIVKGGPRHFNTNAVDSEHAAYEYKSGVAMFVLYSRDVNSNNSKSDAYAWGGSYDSKGDAKGNQSNLRYKYLLPRAAGTDPASP
jgi:prepilin-type N-terminal cleavage/methylation domain-containing protein